MDWEGHENPYSQLQTNLIVVIHPGPSFFEVVGVYLYAGTRLPLLLAEADSLC